ncbi:MAG: tetratricopeptide repeat protein [Clostridium sp.]
MEILSTGEKIKRARIYKGITLKELCGSKVSISKMSCIENGKIKAEPEILKYISEKINIDYDYLVRDVYEQIEDNLKIIKGNIYIDNDIEEKIRLNLNCAIQYSYYNVAFELIHLLFDYYLGNNLSENIQLIVSQYFDVYQRSNNEENTIIYFKDMAQYLFQNEEYNEAIAYYNRLREIINESKNTDKKLYCLLSFNEGICYSKIKENEKAYKLLKEAIEGIKCVEDELTKGKIYNAFAIICITTKRAEGEKYIKKAYDYQKDNPLVLATSMGEYASAYFEVNDVDKAISEIKEGVRIFPKHNQLKYVQFLNNCIRILCENKEYDYAYELTDEALNLAIATDNVRLIEKAYYQKGTILQKQNNYLTAEMYMNLSMDALFKFGNKDERYRRYLDMADLYYNLGETKESLKYFNLALNIKELI